MINIKIDEEDFLEMLMVRVEDWTDDWEIRELYRKMYENYVYSGVFEDSNLSINVIVDNDYVNYCTIVEPEDDGFDELLKVYKEQGISDISCEDINGWSFIEAVNDEEIPTMFLVRT